ncbi:hypothetical protein TNCV_249131 [Trichonephila clavipes]|nr:hypothetical protein TNCV_249131 [Trichonephila clavipes]
MGTTEEVTPVVEYVFQLINRLKNCQELAIEKMEETKIKRKAWYDKNAIKREFSGDLVLVLKMNRPNKLSVQWKGPGKIEKKISETNYVVSFNNNTESNQVFHVNMLKPYYKRAEFINMINSRAKEDSNELEENFPCIDSNPNIFDFDEITKHRKTHLIEHDIELINDVPIRTKPYRMSARQTDLLQEEIKKMLKYQVIEIGESYYASPMILVETPGRDPRPCIDYRKLNEVIRTQFYPLPNIEHRIETVAAAKYITLLDLTKGYWQIPLTPKAQRLAAFTTSFGTYRPLRMPFGLKNAPYYFSRLMAELLQGCEKFALPYLDDVAIFSENWDDHISHIDKVLERIRDARLTIKPAKCKFAQDSVNHLPVLTVHHSEISINDSGSIDSFSDDFDFDISDDENDYLNQARNFYEIDCNNPFAPPPRFAFTNTPGIHLDFDASSGKMQYYEALIDNNLIDLIVHETNCYAEQTIGSSIPHRHSRSKKWEPTSKEEMHVFIALIILQGLGKRSPAQLKVQTILDFPVPRNKIQVRAFLGIAGYYRQYIPMFSSLAAPLTELLKGKSKKGYINWTSECQESFVQLKEKLSTNRVLYAPDFKRQFILQPDGRL